MKLGQQAMEALKSQIDGALEIGDDLVVAGVIAIEGTQILIEKEKEKLLEYFSDGFLWNTVRTLEKCRNRRFLRRRPSAPESENRRSMPEWPSSVRRR